MKTESLRLYKKEKLCSKIAIEQLFAETDRSRSVLAYPLRAVWRSNTRRSSDAPVQFLISVPKRKIRHAVDRVAMRRRIREAYRLNRLTDLPEDARIDLAIIYVGNEREPYARIERSMLRVLSALAKNIMGEKPVENPTADGKDS